MTTTKFKYTFIGANGFESPIERDTPLTLDEMQRYVGGYIEFVGTSHPEMEMCVNEEGLLHELPSNPVASRMAGRLIVGDVLVATRETFATEAD